MAQLISGFRSEIPLIERLKNEAIRPQHWKELMAVAGQTFDAENKNFRLQDVLNLQLARYPDAVNEIFQAATVWLKENCLLLVNHGSHQPRLTHFRDLRRASLGKLISNS